MKLIKKILTVSLAFVLFAAIPQSTYIAQGDTSYQNDMISFYDTWKEKYIEQDTYVSDETQYYVWYSGEKYTGGDKSVPITVSEAHGYGMLITACMTEYDTDAKVYFDGMYRFYKAHPSSIGSHLMSWQQSDNGVALIDTSTEGSMQEENSDSATDGDMDIAYALLIADKQWGSDGEIDYYSEAVDIIKEIMLYDVNHEYWTLNLGDWVSECDDTEVYYAATRPSDFIMQYMPIFASVTNDDNWLKVYDATYQIIGDMTAEYKTGLLPDFIIRNSENDGYIPAPANFLEDKTDGSYSYNSCRTPWRISADYLINNNKNARAYADAINTFITTKTNNNPDNIVAGYQLNGTELESYSDLCFVAPFVVAAQCSDNMEWKEALWNCIVNYGDDVYYGDTIKMLCMIVCADAWVVPTAKTDLTGDINYDDVVNTSDALILKQHLIDISDMTLEQAQRADLIKDEKIDVFDLAGLKSIILENNIS